MLIYILCEMFAVLATTMFVLFILNDKKRYYEIKHLNEKVDYYIRTLEDREKHEQWEKFYLEERAKA